MKVYLSFWCLPQFLLLLLLLNTPAAAAAAATAVAAVCPFKLINLSFLSLRSVALTFIFHTTLSFLFSFYSAINFNPWNDIPHLDSFLPVSVCRLRFSLFLHTNQ